jgi:tripartite-type tricarboxylate transporter receptor subunit TctC
LLLTLEMSTADGLRTLTPIDHSPIAGAPMALTALKFPSLRDVLLLLPTLVVASFFALPSQAQDYPTKPIRMIVPYPPAGGTDIVARTIAEPLAAALGQPIIIDNRGGAAGNIGTDLAAKSAPDGYTILFTLSSHTINPKLYDKLPFDVEKDFIPISLAAYIPQVATGKAQLCFGRHRFAGTHRG